MVTDFDSWPDTALSLSPDDFRARQGNYPPGFGQGMQFGSEAEHPDAVAYLTDGMTPLDVLSSVFGSTLVPSELEEAPSQNGYDFEKAMAWVIDRALPPPPQHIQPRDQPMVNRAALISRDASPPMLCGGRGYQGRKGHGYMCRAQCQQQSVPLLACRGMFASRLSFQVSSKRMANQSKSSLIIPYQILPPSYATNVS